MEEKYKDLTEECHQACLDYKDENQFSEDIKNNLYKISDVVNLISNYNRLNKTNNSIIDNEPIYIPRIKRSCSTGISPKIEAQRLVEEAVSELSIKLAKKLEEAIINKLLSSSIASFPVQNKDNGSLLDKIKSWRLHIKEQASYVEKPILIIDNNLYRNIYDQEEYYIKRDQVITRLEELLDVEEICVSINDFPPVNEDNYRSVANANIIAINPSRLKFQLNVRAMFGTDVFADPSSIFFIAGCAFDCESICISACI